MILALAGCGPHLAAGPIATELERAHPALEVRPPQSAGVTTWTVVVRAGSDDDPAGREGTAWAVAHAVAGDLGVTVGPATTTFVARCSADGPWDDAGCVARLARIAAPPGPAAPERALAALDALVADEDALLRALVVERTTGRRPAPGRRSVVETLAADELAAFHARRYRRAALALVAEGEVSAAAEDALERVVAAFPGGYPTGEGALSPNRGEPGPAPRAPDGPDLVWVRRPGADATLAVSLAADAVRAAVPDGPDPVEQDGVTTIHLPGARAAEAAVALRSVLGAGAVAVAAEPPPPTPEGWRHLAEITADALVR